MTRVISTREGNAVVASDQTSGGGGDYMEAAETERRGPVKRFP
jgi:hypothetical protein